MATRSALVMDHGTATPTSASTANASMVHAAAPTDGVAMGAKLRSAPIENRVQTMVTAKWARKTSHALAMQVLQALAASPVK